MSNYSNSELFRTRRVWLDDHILRNNATEIVNQMLLLEEQDPYSDIYFWINSPGGEVSSGLFIYDAMNYIKNDVVTIVGGQAASMAAVLASSGAVGKRYMFKNAELMFHTVSAGIGFGKEKDIAISADRIHSLNERLLKIIARNCNKDFEDVKEDLDRDFFLIATEAITYGAVDYII